MNTLTRRDATAAVLTATAVLTFAAAHEGWNVPLVGDSPRWAAVVILALGIGTCGLGRRDPSSPFTPLLSALGAAAAVLGIAAVATGSLTVLSLLVVDYAVLWAMTTFGHAKEVRAKPLAT